MSNILLKKEVTTVVKNQLQNFKHYVFPKTRIHKVVFDLDLLHFHAISFDDYHINSVSEDSQFYDDSHDGTPTYIAIPNGKEDYTYYPSMDVNYIYQKTCYIAFYKTTKLLFSTKAVSHILGVEFDELVKLKFTNH